MRCCPASMPRRTGCRWRGSTPGRQGDIRGRVRRPIVRPCSRGPAGLNRWRRVTGETHTSPAGEPGPAVTPSRPGPAASPPSTSRPRHGSGVHRVADAIRGILTAGRGPVAVESPRSPRRSHDPWVSDVSGSRCLARAGEPPGGVGGRPLGDPVEHQDPANGYVVDQTRIRRRCASPSSSSESASSKPAPTSPRVGDPSPERVLPSGPPGRTSIRTWSRPSERNAAPPRHRAADPRSRRPDRMPANAATRR